MSDARAASASQLFPERIETERLVFEAATREFVDVLDFYETCSASEEVFEYLPWGPHETIGETREYLTRVEEKIENDAEMGYVLRPREGEDGAGRIAGGTGLHVDWDRRSAEFALWLRKRFWGRGYSGERAAAMMDLAFDRLDLDVVEVTHEAGNEKSRRAIEKYVEAHGGRHEGLFRNVHEGDNGPVDLRRYTVTRSEYRTSR